MGDSNSISRKLRNFTLNGLSNETNNFINSKLNKNSKNYQSIFNDIDNIPKDEVIYYSDNEDEAELNLILGQTINKTKKINFEDYKNKQTKNEIYNILVKKNLQIKESLEILFNEELKFSDIKKKNKKILLNGKVLRSDRFNYLNKNEQFQNNNSKKNIPERLSNPFFKNLNLIEIENQ